MTPSATPRGPSLSERVDGVDWTRATQTLDNQGAAPTGPILTTDECRRMIDCYDDDHRFRSTIDMARHRFGQGQYRYFDHPLPHLVTALRAAFWPHLVPVARDWAQRRDEPTPWNDQLDDWLSACHAAGQDKPAPLMLRYGPATGTRCTATCTATSCSRSRSSSASTNPTSTTPAASSVMVEQRPRAQSRASTFTIPQGHGVVLTSRDRPIETKRGWSRAPMRHGVSTLRSGRRHTLGIIFHDAD